MINPRFTRGFTLIELLLVISIIGMLATIVLASFSTAKQKAIHVVEASKILDYSKAFELYRIDHSTKLPLQNSWPAGTSEVCLGEFPSDTCYAGTGNPRSENAALNAALSPYISDMKGFSAVPEAWSNLVGPLYKCISLLGSSCNQIEILWWIPQDTPTCGVGSAIRNATGLNAWQCEYVL